MAGASPTNGNGTKWWQTWLPMIAAGVIVIGAVASYFINQGGESVTLANLQTRVSSLEGRMNKNSADLSALEKQDFSFEKTFCQNLDTVEVQMGTVETILNKTQVVNERDLALLWDKTYNQQYPSIFYPVSIPHDPPNC